MYEYNIAFISLIHFVLLFVFVFNFFFMAFAFIFKEHFTHGRNNFLFNLDFKRNENIKSFCLFFLLFSRSSRPDVFLGKGILKKCSKFTGEHPSQSVISIKLLCNFTEIALRHGCSLVKFAAYLENNFS